MMRSVCSYLMTTVFVATIAAAAEPKAAPERYADGYSKVFDGESRSTSELVNEFLAAKGWATYNERENGDYFLVFRGVAPIAVHQGHPQFCAARLRAFQLAVANAQAEFASFLSSKIRAGLESVYAEGNQDQLMDLLKAAAAQGAEPDDAELEKVAADEDGALGLRMAGPHALDLLVSKSAEDGPKAVASESFRNFIGNVSQARAAGLSMYKCFEAVPKKGSGEVSVVMVWSETLQSLVESMRGTREVVNAAKAKSKLSEQIPDDVSVLLHMYGVQSMVDEKGRIALIAYGQAEPRTKSRRMIIKAYEKAKLAAMGALRMYCADNVFRSSTLSEASTVTEFEDASAVFRSSETYQERIAVTAEALSLPGCQTFKTWDVEYPVNGKPVCGAVVIWHPKASNLSRAINARQNDGPADKRPHVAANEKKPAPVGDGDRPVPERPADEAVEGAGRAGDEDAF